MSHSAEVEASSSQIRKLWERHGIRAPLRFLGFCLSLLPLPVIQQAGQALDRHLSDKEFDARLEEIWGEITRLNSRTVEAESVEDSMLEIAKTVEANPHLRANVMGFLRELGTHQKEFCAIADDSGFQHIVHSFIAAESAKFLARSGGHNSIEHTTVNAESTLLHSSGGGSSNYVNQTTFRGVGGAVSMNSISTHGNVNVSGSGISIGANSGIVFGGNPYLIYGDCPKCGARIEVDRRALAGHSHVQCLKCKAIHEFSLPDA
ncbi:hypothetical protein ACKI1H_00895 [Pseudomonas sp. YH-1]|uniref:hypothetical protein n=1 Tax=Pseudomonas sp. YH-1 TaxID=3384787 RepID=UPI003F7FABEA